MSVPIAVFASGGGTNLQALLDHFGAGPAGEVGRIALVVSDRGEAGALERAREAGVPAAHIPIQGRELDDVGRDTLAALEEHDVGLVALAGYLRLVPPVVVRRLRGRMVNVHPALLPSFGGKGMYGARVHQAVLAAGCRVSGVTVHLVDEEYDRGAILAQWPVPVLEGDTPESLAARALRVEHRLYPLAVEALAASLLIGERAADGEASPAVSAAPGTGSALERGEPLPERLFFDILPGDAPLEPTLRRLL